MSMRLRYAEARPFVFMDGNDQLFKSDRIGIFYTVTNEGLCTLHKHGPLESVEAAAQHFIERMEAGVQSNPNISEQAHKLIEGAGISFEMGTPAFYQKMIDEVRVIDVTEASLDDINFILDRTLLKEEYFLALSVISSESTALES